MKAVQCENGHYYDADKYKACPFCDTTNIKSEVKDKEESVKRDRFSFSPGDVKTNSEPKKKSALQELMERKKTKSEGKTIPLYNPINEDDITSIASTGDGDKYFASTCASDNKSVMPTEKEPVKEKESEGMNLQKQMQQVVSSEPKTIGMWGDNVTTEPVVGWLVCVSGDNQGEAYEIHSGKNFIGRDIHMDIAITGDLKISRQKHASLMYEPKSRQFILLSAEGEGMTYLNDSILLNNEVLKAKDKIAVGDTILLFIPLCDESFTWEDWIKKE